MEPLDPTPQSAICNLQSVIVLGVDLGQKHDPTAIVVVEVQPHAQEPSAHPVAHYVVRTVLRLDLGTPYPAVVRRLAEIDAQLRARGAHPEMWVDATGLGKPVVDLLKDADLYVREVYLNGTDQAVKGERGELRLGKCLLVSRLQVLLQSERIHLPATPEAALLVDELLNYEIRVNDDAHAQFGAFKLGAHDDLATALGLACWDDHPFHVPGVSIPQRDVIAECDRPDYWFWESWRARKDDIW